MGMENINFHKPLRCYGPDHVLAYVRWTPASSPAAQVITDAQGVSSVTRTAAGTYTVTFPYDVKDIIPMSRGVTAVTPTSGTATVTSTASNTTTVYCRIEDVSAASTGRAVATVGGKVTKVWSVLGGAITVANAAVVTNIAGTPITGGALTVAYSGSAAGDIDSATPTAANTVTAGQLLTAVSDGGSTDTQTLDVFFVIEGTAPADVNSELTFAFLLRVAN